MSMFCPGLASRRYRRAWSSKSGLVAACMVLFTANAVVAQSAADKATARQLATQGIQSYQQGKNAEALELLQKAQQLYDAPIHLIYIARAQAALGKLVDASETYRRLARTDLPAGAPQAFKDAVSDAHKELQQLEPRIPSLRIDVSPADAPGLRLKLDGELLSSVVIGINRPTNPGKHTVEVSANGFDPASATVELSQGGKQTVTLRLKARPGGGAETAEPATDTSGVSASEQPASEGSSAAGTSGQARPKTTPEPPFDRGSQIVVGVRGVLASPGGTLRLGGAEQQAVAVNGVGSDGQPNTNANTSDRFGAGGGFELRAGYRLPLGRQFALTPLLTYQSSWYDKGKYYSQPIGSIIQDYAIGSGGSSTVLQISPTESLIALGAAVEYPMPSSAWTPSYYAELGFVLHDQLQATGTATTGTSACKVSDKFIGRGLKIGLGLLLPAAKLFRFSVGIGYTAVATTGHDYSDTCERTGGESGVSYKGTFSGSDQKVHSLITAGLGGDLMIGL